MDEAIKDDLNLDPQDVSADDANQDTVDVAETDEKPARQLSKRELKLKEIEDKRAAEIHGNEGEPRVEREFQQITREDDAPDEPDDVPPEAAKPKQETEKPSPIFLNDEGEYVMKLKINGAEVIRKVDQIQASLQKDLAGELKLQQASERDKALSQREQHLQQREAEMLARINSQPSEQDAGIDVSDEEYSSLLDAIYDGDKDAGINVLKKLMNGRQQPTLNVDEIKAQASQAAIAEVERKASEKAAKEAAETERKSLISGMTWLQETHPEVIQDEFIYGMIDNYTDTVAAKNPDLSPDEVIKKATGEVLERFGRKEAKPNNRTDNKSNLRMPPQQANSRYSPPKKDEIDMSPAAVIARQREARMEKRAISN